MSFLSKYYKLVLRNMQISKSGDQNMFGTIPFNRVTDLPTNSLITPGSLPHYVTLSPKKPALSYMLSTI